MQESEIARSRERSQKAKNRKRLKNAKNMNIKMKMKNVEIKMLNKKKQAFQDSTTRELSQFERVLIKTITSDEMNTKTTLAVHRADSVLNRKRE